MDVERRSVLSGIALTSFAGVALNNSFLSLPDAAVASDTQPARLVLALVGDATEQSAFLQGIAAASYGGTMEIQRTNLSNDFVQKLNQTLRARQSIRVIGLVDDASAALIVQLARSAGARLQWLGQHSVSAGQSRHHVLSAESAHGCAAQLGQQLQTCGAGFSLREQRLHGANASLELAGQLRKSAATGSEQWAAILGFALASLGATRAAPPLAGATKSPLFGHFVSFSIES